MSRQATTKSMIIMDELGRGTSVKDGLAIAIAVSEKLIKMKSRVFFATHFTGLGMFSGSPSPFIHR